MNLIYATAHSSKQTTDSFVSGLVFLCMLLAVACGSCSVCYPYNNSVRGLLANGLNGTEDNLSNDKITTIGAEGLCLHAKESSSTIIVEYSPNAHIEASYATGTSRIAMHDSRGAHIYAEYSSGTVIAVNSRSLWIRANHLSGKLRVFDSPLANVCAHHLKERVTITKGCANRSITVKSLENDDMEIIIERCSGVRCRIYFHGIGYVTGDEDTYAGYAKISGVEYFYCLKGSVSLVASYSEREIQEMPCKRDQMGNITALTPEECVFMYGTLAKRYFELEERYSAMIEGYKKEGTEITSWYKSGKPGHEDVEEAMEKGKLASNAVSIALGHECLATASRAFNRN